MDEEDFCVTILRKYFVRICCEYINQYVYNMNLYIFNEVNIASMYGIGTYVRELTTALKNSDVNIWVINLNTDKPQIEYEDIDGIFYLYFPSPIQWSIELPEQWDLYHRNVIYWLQLNIKDKKESTNENSS